MLAHRWGILHKPINCNISICRTTAMVMALCKLHNFCIDANDENIAQPTAQDTAQIHIEGGVPLDGRIGQPTQLTDCGHHFEDTNRNFRRNTEREALRNNDDEQLPRDKLHDMVVQGGFVRPKPIQRH